MTYAEADLEIDSLWVRGLVSLLITSISLAFSFFLSLGAIGQIWSLFWPLQAELTPTQNRLLTLAFLGTLTLLATLSSATGQHMLLRSLMPALPRRAWIVATTLGGCICCSIAIILSRFPHSYPASFSVQCGIGSMIGAIVGIAQWSVLRRHTVRSSWWIVWSIVMWTISIGILVFLAAPPSSREVPF